MPPLKLRDVAALFMLALIFVCGGAMFAGGAPAVPAAIADARAFDHPSLCAPDATTTAHCLRVSRATLTNLHRSTGSRGGTTYYVSIRLADGTLYPSLSVAYSFYRAAAIGDPVSVQLWGPHLTYIADGRYAVLTDDTPVSAAGGVTALALLGTTTMIACLGGGGLVYGRARRRGIVADLDAEPITYRPSPTQLSWLARLGWWLPLIVGAALWGIIIDAFALIAIGAGILALALLVINRQCNASLTLSREGLIYQRGKQAPVQAPWAHVMGIRTFGAGRGRYQAIGLADGRRIRHQTLVGFTALNESLRYTIAKYARFGASVAYATYLQPATQIPIPMPTPAAPYPGYIPYTPDTGVPPAHPAQPPPGGPPAYPPGWPPST